MSETLPEASCEAAQTTTLGSNPCRLEREVGVADFRVSLPERPDDTSARELDWDRDAGLWTVSEREYGSSTWFLGMPADAWDLGQILVFFRMTEPVREENLARMSPGECAMAHASQQG